MFHLVGAHRLWAPAGVESAQVDAFAESLREIARRKHRLDGWSCGLTAAYSILDFFRPGASSIRKLRKYCDPDPDEGCGPSEISSALRRFGLKCRITRSLSKRVVDAVIRKGNPILIGVEGDLLGFDEDHWMVIHGIAAGEVLLSNNLYPGKSSQWVSWAWLKPGLEPAGWGMVVSA